MTGRWRLPVGGGVRLSGREAGSGPHAMVLLHGGASNHRWWDPVARLLATRYRMIWWDQRGHGDSSPGECTVDRLADDAAAVLARLGVADAVVVGHSAGAAVALAVAARAGHRAGHRAAGHRAAGPAAGPVVVGPSVAGPSVAGPSEELWVTAVGCVEGGLYDPRLLFGATWDRARRAMTSARRGRVTEAVLRAWLPSAGLPPEALAAVVGNYESTADGGLRLRLAPYQEEQLAYSVWTQDLATLLPAVEVPVLVVAAENTDTEPRRVSISRARELIGGPLIEQWIPGGHDLPLQRPEAVAAAIDRLAAPAPNIDRRRQYVANDRIGARGPKRGAAIPANSSRTHTRPR